MALFYESPRAPYRGEARDPIEESRAPQSETDFGTALWAFVGLAALFVALMLRLTAPSVQLPSPADTNAELSVQTQPMTPRPAPTTKPAPTP